MTAPETLPVRVRHDGWTPDRQRSFLAAIAGGHTVERACRLVGLTVSSAYALRRRAAGAPFALGWQAASLLARDTIADGLTARALDGQTETVTRPDGSTITRHRFDNGLALRMLDRLDRLAEADGARATQGAARLVAQDWEAYLDLVERDACPARAGMFLAARRPAGTADSLFEPIVALARTDEWLRTRAALAGDVAIDDLDPEHRATWTAGHWARAEAAGLLVLAPAPPCDVAAAAGPPLPPLIGEVAFPGDEPGPVWWCNVTDQWRTSFPPSGGDAMDEDGEFGDEHYSRALDDAELALFLAPQQARIARRAIEEGRARDTWFATHTYDGDADAEDDADDHADADGAAGAGGKAGMQCDPDHDQCDSDARSIMLLCSAERLDGAVHPHHRLAPRRGQDRARQPRLQPAPPDLPRTTGSHGIAAPEEQENHPKLVTSSLKWPAIAPNPVPHADTRSDQ